MNPNFEPHFTEIIDDASSEELKLIALRAIDYARKSVAEINEYQARLDGAIGLIGALREENRQLKSAAQASKK